MAGTFEEFANLLEPHRRRWAAVEVRVLAYDGPVGLQNLLTHAVVRFRDQVPPGSERVRISKRLVAIATRQPIDALWGLLGEFERGGFEIAADAISLASDRHYHFSVSRLRAGETYRDERVCSPAFLLQGGGPSFSQIVGNAGMNDVNWELRSAASPYESADDFWEDFLELPPRGWSRGFGDVAQVIVTAPLGFQLDPGSHVRDGQVEVHVRALGDVPEAPVRVGLIARAADRVLTRTEIVLRGSDWAPVTEGVVAPVSWAVPGISQALVVVSVGEEVLLTQGLVDHARSPGHPRLALHGQLDQQLAGLRRSLQGEGRDRANDFELGVAMLLHLSGFATMHYGRGALTSSDVPDIVAFHPVRPTVIVGECTLRDIDSQSKLSKLYERVSRLKGMLGDHLVVPVVFTILPRDRVAHADLEKARKSGIHVVCRAELDRLSSEVVTGSSPDKVMSELALLGAIGEGWRSGG